MFMYYLLLFKKIRKYIKEYQRRRPKITATRDGSKDNKEDNGGSSTNPKLEALILMDNIFQNVVQKY